MNLKIRRTQAMNNFWQRTLTGIAFVAVILTSIYFQDKYFIFTGIFGLVNILALYEFYKITNISDRVNVPTIYLIICGTILYFGCFWLAKYGGEIVIVCYAMCIVALLIAELYRKKAAPTHNIAFSLMGQAIVAVPFGLLNFIAIQQNVYWLYALFILIWTFDTGAYVFGVSFGKHKIFPRISPKKSWEGEIGGAILTIIGSLIFAYLKPEIAIWKWIVFGSLIIIFGTYGDLSESLLKRTASLKDSGTILPGHGGMLDRFDSLMLIIPVIYIYLQFIEEI